MLNASVKELRRAAVLVVLSSALAACGTAGVQIEFPNNYSQSRSFDEDGIHVEISKTSLQKIKPNTRFAFLSFASREYSDVTMGLLSNAGIAPLKKIDSPEQWEKETTAIALNSAYTLTFGTPEKTYTPYRKEYPSFMGHVAFGDYTDDENAKRARWIAGALNGLTVLATVAAGGAVTGGPTVSAATPKLHNAKDVRTFADQIATAPCDQFGGCFEKFEVVGCILTETFGRCSDQVLVVASTKSATSTRARNLMVYGMEVLTRELGASIAPSSRKDAE